MILHWFPVTELLGAALAGRVTDAPVLIALLTYAVIRGGPLPTRDDTPLPGARPAGP